MSGWVISVCGRSNENFEEIIKHSFQQRHSKQISAPGSCVIFLALLLATSYPSLFIFHPEKDSLKKEEVCASPHFHDFLLLNNAYCSLFQMHYLQRYKACSGYSGYYYFLYFPITQFLVFKLVLLGQQHLITHLSSGNRTYSFPVTGSNALGSLHTTQHC